MGDTHTIPSEALARAATVADLTILLGDGVPMHFRHIPAAPGGFLMGERGDPDAEPVHGVAIDHDFYLGTFPVTQAQYRAVETRWRHLNLKPESSTFKGDHRPVERVTWFDAMAWCAAVQANLGELSRTWKHAGPDSIERFALPNEAEWEYACRGRSGDECRFANRTEYHTGDGAARLSQAGWFGGRLGEDGTHDVGQRSPNGFGLYDMHGSVWEWCEDVWDARAYRKREDGWVARAWCLADAGFDAREGYQSLEIPREPDRVVRGGTWDDPASGCRTAVRSGRIPGSHSFSRGFRVCLVRGRNHPAQQGGAAGDLAES